MKQSAGLKLGVAVAAAVVGLLTPGMSAATTKCRLRFRLSGWSAIYETAHGTGKITCDNGHFASVALHVTGGGVTFSEVDSIRELFGSYAVADVHAGAGASSDAQVLTKGNVSLALAGTGEGINLGFDFGKFTIRSPKK